MAVAQAIPAVRRRMTEEEFLRLPDDGRKWELVDGEAREVLAGYKYLKPFARGSGVLAGSQGECLMERKEFGMSGREYGLLAEGDPGMLTFQGTRYKGFTRSAA